MNCVKKQKPLPVALVLYNATLTKQFVFKRLDNIITRLLGCLEKNAHFVSGFAFRWGTNALI